MFTSFVGSLLFLGLSAVLFFSGRKIPATSYGESGLGFTVNPTYKHNALMHYSKFFCFHIASIFVYVGTLFFVYTAAKTLNWEVGPITLIVGLVVGWAGYRVLDGIHWDNMCTDGFTSNFSNNIKWVPLLVLISVVVGFFLTLTSYTTVTLSKEMAPIPFSIVVKEVNSVSCGVTRTCARTNYRAFLSNGGEVHFLPSQATVGDTCEIRVTKLSDTRQKKHTGEVVEIENERDVRILVFSRQCLS